MPRGHEIWLTYAEGDDVLDAYHKLKELPYA
jgi:hypothetical protein